MRCGWLVDGSNAPPFSLLSKVYGENLSVCLMLYYKVISQFRAFHFILNLFSKNKMYDLFMRTRQLEQGV